MWQRLKPNPRNLRAWQLSLLVALLAFWHAMTTPGLLPLFMLTTTARPPPSSASR